MYITDITDDIDWELRLWADDCVCHCEIKDNENTVKLQEDYKLYRVLGKELGYEIPASQMQYIVCRLQGNRSKDLCFLYLRGKGP